MVLRIANISLSNSFFLFGPRGSGKTTWLREHPALQESLWINLLESSVEDRYSRQPDLLINEIEQLRPHWVVIDEVQKLPRLLDAVHHLIETTPTKFALTGSSARKIARGSANLLAGRAFVYHLFPLTAREYGAAFDLTHALEWGTLPKLLQLSTPDDKADFLRTYALTYLKEEVWNEQLIRQLDPFRRFLGIAAQMNGKLLNYHRIATDVDIDTKTVQSYFSILADTLLGGFLEPYHRSIRKQQRQAPKFYFFDTGVKRALEGTLTQALLPQTYAFGEAFEHWVILEIMRHNAYAKRDYRLYYLRTKDDAEIDLIIERPGKPIALIEIKSTETVRAADVVTLQRFLPEFPNTEAFCLSRDPHQQRIGDVVCLPWDIGLTALGL